MGASRRAAAGAGAGGDGGQANGRQREATQEQQQQQQQQQQGWTPGWLQRWHTRERPRCPRVSFPLAVYAHRGGPADPPPPADSLTLASRPAANVEGADGGRGSRAYQPAVFSVTCDCRACATPEMRPRPPPLLVENTLPAFRAAALGPAAADLLELDVQLTADGHVVVFHDRDLERMFGRPYRGITIDRLRYDQLPLLMGPHGGEGPDCFESSDGSRGGGANSNGNGVGSGVPSSNEAGGDVGNGSGRSGANGGGTPNGNGTSNGTSNGNSNGNSNGAVMVAPIVAVHASSRVASGDGTGGNGSDLRSASAVPFAVSDGGNGDSCAGKIPVGVASVGGGVFCDGGGGAPVELIGGSGGSGVQSGALVAASGGGGGKHVANSAPLELIGYGSSGSVRVPLLSEVLDEFPDVPLQVDLKADTPGLVEAVTELIRSQPGRSERVLWGSFIHSVNKRLRAAAPVVPLFTSTPRVILLYAAFWLGALPLVHIYESAVIVPHRLPETSHHVSQSESIHTQQQEPPPPLPRGIRLAVTCARAIASVCVLVPLAFVRLVTAAVTFGVRLWARVAERALPRLLLPLLLMWLPTWAKINGADVMQWLLVLLLPGWIGVGWLSWLASSALTRAITRLLPSSVRRTITRWSGAELIATLMPAALPHAKAGLTSLLRLLWATLAVAWRILSGVLAFTRALATAAASLAWCGSVDIVDGSFFAALADRGVAVVVYGGPEFDCVQRGLWGR
ncbi:hypothetical protein FOA52_010793 [Chlamydomonas sp. UWO 241]|nr:hypothetical protein FOA52_010793 [Chlamydomonas sp. UWO 241]